VLPLAIYLVAVPDVYAGFVSRYGGTTVDLDVLHHPGALFNARFVADRWPVYRSFFERPFLFELARTHVMSSTYHSGIFPNWMKVLLPLGLYHALRNRRTPFTLLTVALFFLAPISACVIPEKYAIDRVLLFVPAAVLVAAFGVDWLVLPRRWYLMWPARLVCAALFAAMLSQFNDFYREYQTTYPIRASFWFDGNHPGAFEPLVAQHRPDDPRLIYISRVLPRIADHWKLFLIAHKREDLLKRTVFFSPEDLHLGALRPGSLLLTGVDDRTERAFKKMPAVRAVDVVKEPDGSPTFTIFERTTWNELYLFDGTYAVQLEVTCTPLRAHDKCGALPTTNQCPANDTITVANSFVVDACGYLRETMVSRDGWFESTSNYGTPLFGRFATNGPIYVAGGGESEGRYYDFTFVLTRRN